MVLSGFMSQRAIWRTALLLGCLAWNCGRAAPSDVAGTLPEDLLPELKMILGVALQRSPEVIAKEFERMTAEARLDMEKAGRLPQVRGDFNYATSQTATAASSSSQTRDSGFFYNFGVNQALFHWGELKNKADAARLNILVQEKRYAQAYRDLSVKLRGAYLSLIVEKARLRQSREALAVLTNDVAVARAKKERGTVSAAALASEELRLRENTLDVDRAEADFAANRRRFARTAGLPDRDLPPERVADEIPAPKYSEPQASALAAAFLRDNARGSFEYEVYDLRLKEAVLRQKIEAVRLLPKIDANANYSLENTTNVNGNIAEQRAVTRQTLGVGGSWAIFDGFATRGAKREALVNKRALEQSKAVDIDLLLQNAQKLERDLKFDAEQLALADIRQGMSIEAHARISQEVGLGNLAKDAIARAKVGILDAAVKTFAARAVYLQHWSEFVSLTTDDPVLTNLPARYVREKK